MTPRPYVHDTLEREYAHGRISLPGYGAAKIYQRILEASEGRSPGPMLARDAPHEHVLETANDLAREMTDRQMALEHKALVASNLGDGARLLNAVLLDGATFSEIAAEAGLRSKWAINRVAHQFIRACDALAGLYESRHAERLLSRDATNNE
jgi:hypothetical protein